MNLMRALALMLAFASAAAAQSPTVTVAGAVKDSLVLSAADFAAFPRDSVVTSSNGMATTYQGTWISHVLAKAGVPLGSALRGPALSSYVLATATDGYQVVFSLAELDPEMASGRFLLAYQANGQPLMAENGAFRIVAADDKRGARSIRMLARLEVVQVRK